MGGASFRPPGRGNGALLEMLVYNGFTMFFDYHGGRVFLPTSETLVLPRFFNDCGGLFLLPTNTGNGP